MTAQSLENSEQSWRRLVVALLGCAMVLAAGSFGYFMGAGLAHGEAWGERLETPLGRVGYRMVLNKPQQIDGLPALARDLPAAIDALGQPEGQILGLISELGCFGQEPDLIEAATACRALGWTRCDDAALRRMQEVLKK